MKRETTDGRPPVTGFEDAAAPAPIDPATGQHGAYWVLPAEERARGYQRPVRQSYEHTVCGATTTMGLALAETYARDPTFYGATFCATCRTHRPVQEFVWAGTDEVVGS